MLREVRGTFRGTPYVVRLISQRQPSDTLDSWYNAEWEIDCEAIEVIAFAAYAGDTEAYVRAQTDMILAMLLEAKEARSYESA